MGPGVQCALCRWPDDGLDRAALAAYCAAYGRWAQARRAINRMAAKDGLNAALMIKTVSGNVYLKPLVGIAVFEPRSDMVRYAASSV